MRVIHRTMRMKMRKVTVMLMMMMMMTMMLRYRQQRNRNLLLGVGFLHFLQPRSAQCFAFSALIAFCLQCFDAVGWAAGRASGL